MDAEPAALPYRQDIRGCLAARIGEAGLSQRQLDALCDEVMAALGRLRSDLEAGGLRGIAQARARDDLAALGARAARFADRFDDLVVIATGGSNRGAMALSGLHDPARAPRRVHFLDNLDAHTLGALLAGLDLARTGFLAVSKSGATMEVMAQLLACIEALRAVLGGNAARDHLLAISAPGDNPLRQVAARLGFTTLDHEPAIGGRYSVLSPVGLLPALYLGLDGAAVRGGAESVLAASLAASRAGESAPALGAAVAVGLARHRAVDITVFMPYGDRLAPLSLWHAQLWAESLGKGGAGLTPLPANGPVDQHGLLQLFLDGPGDKMFTLLGGGGAEGPAVRGNGLAVDAIRYLEGRTIAELVDATWHATAEALIARGRPTRLIRLEALDERTLGALFMHFMLETVLAADLLGVDPFDQPAVEAGKILARRHLERPAGERTPA